MEINAFYVDVWIQCGFFCLVKPYEEASLKALNLRHYFFHCIPKVFQ